MKYMKLRLTLDVTFEVESGLGDESTLRENMAEIASHAASEGLMSANTGATVETWEARVEEVR